MDLVYPTIAGLSVVASSIAARRSSGRLGGLLAAAPITPTFAVLAMGAEPAMLTRGLPVVGVTAVLVAWLLGVRLRGLLLASPVVLLGPLGWTVGIVGVARAASLRTMGVGPRRSKGLPLLARFFVGAGTVLFVAAASQWMPAMAPYLAMAPWLFVAALIAAVLDQGPSGGRTVLRGGIVGIVGVAGYAWAAAWAAAWSPDIAALGIGWVAYIAIAWAWGSGTRTPAHLATSPPPDAATAGGRPAGASVDR